VSLSSVAAPPAKEPESRPLTLGRIWAEISHALAPADKMPGMSHGTPGVTGNRGTPNPENDTGDVHPGNPPATQFGRTGPSLAELAMAQHRQVSQPGDDQHSPDRVHANFEVAVKEVMRQHQDGRIDEGPGSAARGRRERAGDSGRRRRHRAGRRLEARRSAPRRRRVTFDTERSPSAPNAITFGPCSCRLLDAAQRDRHGRHFGQPCERATQSPLG
jgi:hypothetical protein